MQKTTNTVWHRIVGCFVGGLLAILPIALTVTIVIWVTGFVQGFVGPNTVIGGSLESLGLRFASNRVIAYAIGWVFVLGTVFVLGLIVEMGAKRLLQRWVDAVLKRIPLQGRRIKTWTQGLMRV